MTKKINPHEILSDQIRDRVGTFIQVLDLFDGLTLLFVRAKLLPPDANESKPRTQAVLNGLQCVQQVLVYQAHRAKLCVKDFRALGVRVSGIADKPPRLVLKTLNLIVRLFDEYTEDTDNTEQITRTMKRVRRCVALLRKRGMISDEPN